MTIDRDKIREMQVAVLRRCGDRIERAGYTAAECYHAAGKGASTPGLTGGMRSKHGL